MKLPNTVERNTYKAYIVPPHPDTVQAEVKPINAIDLKWDQHRPETLRVLCIRCMASDWWQEPVFQEIPALVDRNFLLDILDVQLPLDDLSKHIREDVFWLRCFQARWRNFYPHSVEQRPWVSLYMERYLAEHLESMKPVDWDEERMIQMLKVCGPHVESISVGQLQPAMDEENDHIRIDVVLKGLPELQRLDISYALKSVGTEFFLGCSNVSPRDIKWLSQGLEACDRLVEFRLHSTNMEPLHLRSLSKALGSTCLNMEFISLSHCGVTDQGLIWFLRELKTDAFLRLKHLSLTDNHITYTGAVHLAEVIYRRPLEVLDMRLNPIGPNGAAAILFVISRMPILFIDLSGCFLDASITELICSVLSESPTLKELNLSANFFGKEFGATVAGIEFSRQLQELDLRNTGIDPDDKCVIDAAILDNRMRF